MPRVKEPDMSDTSDSEMSEETDDSSFVSHDSSDFENMDSNFDIIDSLLKNDDTTVKNINQEVGPSKDSLENVLSCFKENENVYIFENTDSSPLDKYNVNDSNCVGMITIREETEGHREQTMELENNKYPTEVNNTKCNDTSKTCKIRNSRNHSAVQTVNIDLVAGVCYLEYGSTSPVEYSDFKPSSRGVTMVTLINNEKRDFKPENAAISMVSLINNEKRDFKPENAAVTMVSLRNNEKRDLKPGSGAVTLIKKKECKMKRKKHHRTYRAKVRRSFSKPPYTCTVCEEVFRRAVDLRTHMFTHSERTCQCSVCHKGFKTSIGLRQHMFSHNTERPHKCHVCDKGFKRKPELDRHLISHSNEKPHGCNICEKSFKTTRNLRRHMVSHSIARPHVCPICRERFKRDDALKRHIFNHSARVAERESGAS